MYRGQSGMWSWLLHRVTGVAILLFLLVHIVDITILGFGPTVYNNALTVFSYPFVRLVSLGLSQDLGGADLIGTVAAFQRRQQTYYDGSVYNLSYLQQVVGRRLLTPTGFDLPIARYAAQAPVANRQDNLSAELRLQSHAGGPLTWTAGFFLQRSRQRDDEAIVDPQFEVLTLALFGQPGAELYDGYDLLPGARSYAGRIAARDRQAAAFGEATWRMTPWWAQPL